MTEKILLVDDEPHVLAALCRNLGRRFVLHCAESGSQALAAIDREGPLAAIVSDMRMPGMHGLDLLRQVRSRSPETVRLGVGLSVDDFGTGHSSLSRLRQLPMGKLKIDRSFVCDAADDPDARSIVRMIVGLGHGLGMSVLAEGIETVAQMQTLRDAGCDAMQGYYLARPMPAEDFPAWLATPTNIP